MRIIISAILFALAAVAGVNAHGYMNSPGCRGCSKGENAGGAVGTRIFDPDPKNVTCRGMPEEKAIDVNGTIKLGFKIVAAHTGPCTISILDKDLKNPIIIDGQNDCNIKADRGPWEVKIPKNITGRKVLRWYWEARHLKPYELYQQCIDINILSNKNDTDPNCTTSSLLPSSTPTSASNSSTPVPPSSGPTSAPYAGARGK